MAPWECLKIIENGKFFNRFTPIVCAIWHPWSVPHGTIGVCHMAPSECLKIIENGMFFNRFAPIVCAIWHQWSVPYGTIGVCHMASIGASRLATW